MFSFLKFIKFSNVRSQECQSLPTISGRPGLFDPVSEVPHEIEEKVSFRNRDDLVSNLDEEREALRTLEVEAVGDGGTEVLGSSRGVNFESFVRVIREVDLTMKRDMKNVNMRRDMKNVNMRRDMKNVNMRRYMKNVKQVPKRETYDPVKWGGDGDILWQVLND